MRIPVEGTELYVDVDGPQLEVRGQDVIARPTLLALHGGPGFDHVQLKPALGPLRAHAQIVYSTCGARVAPAGRRSRPARSSRRPTTWPGSAAVSASSGRSSSDTRRVGSSRCTSRSATPRSQADSCSAARRRPWSRARTASPRRCSPTVPARRRPRWLRACSAGTCPRTRLRSSPGSSRPSMPGRRTWRCRWFLARSIPHAELLLLEEAGHFSFAGDPDRFREAVVTFLGKVEAGAAR